MKPPIIIHDNGDVEFYSSVQDAELDIEAVDVRNGVYRFFDSEGRELVAAVSARDTVAISCSADGACCPEELRDILVLFFSQVSDCKSLVSATLSDLIRYGARFFQLEGC